MASTKVRDYAKLAADIKDQVGENNIISAAHCATRLRLVLKESPSAEITKRISEMPSVIQVVEKGGQYQIVIGTHAKDVYEELTKIMKIDESVQAEIRQGIFARIIATMSAVFAPFVYILAAAGLVQGALIIITQFAPAFAETGTYSVLSFISWTPFTFLPVMIAVTASKHFKCNTYIALWCCLALVNADWGAIAARIAGGEVVRFLAFPMAQTTYTSTVLPPLFLVLVLTYLEHFLDKRLPDVLKAIGTPFICAIIMVPLTILVIGPIADATANGIAVAYNYLAHTVPAIAGALVGGIWEVFVIFGVHWGVTPMNIANFNANGCDTFQAFQTCAVVAQAAACFGVVLKTKKKDMKRVAFSSGLTGVFDITEPAIYGVTLSLKKPFVCGCVGGAVGAIIISLFGTQYYAYAGLPGLLTTVNAISNTNPTSFPGMVIGTLATIVITIGLVMVVGCDEKVPVASPSDENHAAPAPIATPEAITVYAPLNGQVKSNTSVNDPTFAQGVLGQGAAIIPTEGKLYAPFDCTVFSVADTRHAISLIGPGGIEMIIHIGLDTVELAGKCFSPKVKDGDTIKAGDLLMEFDLEEIRKKYDTITPILVTNANNYDAIELLKEGETVQIGEPILTIKR
ncbi:MAG: PTS transporter subunit EIIC [Lachnospiraceae bacterium]|nr:PTS transporter subunit EIIC [Lachnospiraceae bacterium]